MSESRRNPPKNVDSSWRVSGTNGYSLVEHDGTVFYLRRGQLYGHNLFNGGDEMASSNKLRAITFVSGFCGIVFVGAWASTATAADRIALMARSVFERAGGTDKGLMQIRFKAARAKIDDALDRLAAEGILGGDTAPQAVIKRDISNKDPILRTDFLQYFRGLASERDLELRRKHAELAAAQANAAGAAADAERQQALAQEEEARAQEAINDANQNERDCDPQIKLIENPILLVERQLLRERLVELEWYRLHPNQICPDRKPHIKSTDASPTRQVGTTAGPQSSRGGNDVPPLTTTGPGGAGIWRWQRGRQPSKRRARLSGGKWGEWHRWPGEFAIVV